MVSPKIVRKETFKWAEKCLRERRTNHLWYQKDNINRKSNISERISREVEENNIRAGRGGETAGGN